jgi:predicted molibdopterin-dependent oxidoreductase YjgC
MTKTVRLKIDNQEVEVDRGKMILDAAEAAGVKIPILCYDRRLVPFGACRLCVVQQKGKRDLQLACFTPCRDGMEIITQSPEITRSRKLQLQLILLNHPMICPRCEKEGDCSLQTLVYEYGVEETQYPWEKIPSPIDRATPLIQRDPNKCILCGRCVRICDEAQGIGELSFTGRGIRSTIDTDFSRPMDCEFCGQCLDTCPVASIISDCFDYSIKAWELTETTAPCPYCGCGCLLTIGSKAGEVKRVFSDPTTGPSDGNLCVKGRFGWDFIDRPDRIKTPLIRVDGELKEASWEEAIHWVAKELEAAKIQSGPDAVGALVSARLTNEEYYLAKRVAKEAIGTERIGLGGHGGPDGLMEGLSETLGIPASTSSIRELRRADCILIVGTDPAETHPIVKNEVHLAIRRNRAQVIVIGSYDIGLSRNTQMSPLSPAALSLLEKPGMELPILNGMIRTILKEGLEDKEFIQNRTEGFEALKEKLLSSEPEATKALSHTGKRDLEKAARAFARAKNGMILIGAGEWSHLSRKEIAVAAADLAAITGHLGKASSGILILQEKSNSQGAIDQGILPNTGQAILKKVGQGKINALYVIGEDPLAKAPRPGVIEKAFESLQFLVVQDLFMTETVKRAHVVLPAASFVEKEGTYTNLERRVQKLNPLRPPAHGSKPDFDILLHLLRSLEHPAPGETPETVFREICRQNPCYQGIEMGGQWPRGMPYLYSDGFPNGKAKLVPVEDAEWASFREAVSGAHPLLLIQRPSLFQSGLLSLRSENLGMVQKKPLVEINPEDARTLGIESGEVVSISNPAGQSMKIEAKISKRPVQGVVTVPWPCPLIEEGGIAQVKVEKLK